MVLVILAILAAILVPALLGWIDESRKKQYVLDARNVYLATQAVVDEIYASKGIDEVPGEFKGGDPDDGLARIKTIADVSFDTIEDIGFDKRVDGTTVGVAINAMKIKNLKGEVNATLDAVTGEWDIQEVSS